MGSYEDAVIDFGKKAADETAELCKELGIPFDEPLCECVKFAGLEKTKEALKGLKGVKGPILTKIDFLRDSGVGRVLKLLPLPVSQLFTMVNIGTTWGREKISKIANLFEASYPFALAMDIANIPAVAKLPLPLLKNFDVYFGSEGYDPRLNELYIFLQSLLNRGRDIPRKDFDNLVNQLSDSKFFRSRVDKLIPYGPFVTVAQIKKLLDEIEKIRASTFNYCIYPSFMLEKKFQTILDTRNIFLPFVANVTQEQETKLYNFKFNFTLDTYEGTVGRFVLSLWKLEGQTILWVQQIQQLQSVEKLRGLSSPMRRKYNAWRSYLFSYLEQNAKRAGIKKILVSVPEFIVEEVPKAWPGHKIPADSIEQNYGEKTMAKFGYKRSEFPLTISYVPNPEIKIINYFYVKEL